MNDIVPFEEMQREAAKVFSKETAANIFGFLADITRPPAKELGGLLADYIKYFRFKTQLKILKMATENHKACGFKAQEVPIKFLSNLLESCSWEDDEYMQSMWGVLLSNAACKGEKTTNYNTYVELLKQLTPIQAKCVEAMYEELEYPARRSIRQVPSYQTARTLMSALNISFDKLSIILDNLMRLNLIYLRIKPGKDNFNTQVINIERNYNEFSLTYLGLSLVKKCRIPITNLHLEKIRVICLENIDDVAKNPDSHNFNEMYKAMQGVYEYLTINDVRTAVWQAFGKYIWKGHNIKQSIKPPYSSELKNKIIELMLNSIKEIHT